MNPEYVGYSGSGNFAQSGGGHTVGILYVGYNSGGQGASVSAAARPCMP